MTLTDVAGDQVFAGDGEGVEGEVCYGFIAVTARGVMVGTRAGRSWVAYGGAVGGGAAPRSYVRSRRPGSA
ncbi:hypothetical protein [Nonomuraea fuscirosea]|uniref:hypothetical protein n=1 Tax=Nonomuraea fuscirosea TaxID=1291556 RepID=UPI0034450C52